MASLNRQKYQEMKVGIEIKPVASAHAAVISFKIPCTYIAILKYG